MQNPRTVIAKLLRDWGSDILLQRRIFDTGKGPYALPNEAAGIYGQNSGYNTGAYGGVPEGDEDLDPQVPGSYFSNKLERWTVHYSMATRKTQIPDLTQGRPEGQSVSPPLVAYFTWDAMPKEGDRVYIQDARFGNELTTWLIRYADQVVGPHGEVSFYLAGMFREENPTNKFNIS